jgi:hypothetical protein
MDDPYQAPQSEIVPPGDRRGAGALKAAVRQWEKLRIAYNVCLIIVALLASFPVISSIGVVPYGIFFVLYLIAANVCYCLGPLGEVYISVFTPVPMRRLRLPIFIAGTVGSLLLTLVIGLQSW